MALQKNRCVVIGGGYAGLSVVLGLARRADFDVTLIDAGDVFVDLTHLHKTVQSPLAEFCHPYRNLAQRYGFRFHRLALDFGEQTLEYWQRQGAINHASGAIPFDYLVVCTGARGRDAEAARDAGSVIDLERIKQQGLNKDLRCYLKETAPNERFITIVGGGATGIQFLFELDDHLRLKRERCVINFVHAGERLLADFPEPFHEHVRRKIRSRNGTIDYFPETLWLAQQNDTVELQSQGDGERLEFPSGLTLSFAGVTPQPLGLNADEYGRVCSADGLLERVLCAGDCARYAGSGFNALTAQAAVRKGRLVAENLTGLAKGKPLRGYDYRALGYFVSLGSWDGIGWLLLHNNIVTGVPAFAVKSAVEAQFALFLEGVDTFVG